MALADREQEIQRIRGAFDTDRLKKATEASAKAEGKDYEAVCEARRHAVPAGRFGTADEFGAVCAFLCSSHVGYLTGQNVLLDGGAYPGTF